MYEYEYPHPAVTTDIVIFTIRDGAMQVLLIKRRSDPFKGSWALPGGFVQIDEDLESAAARELQEETGVDGIYLEQLYTFGAPGRDPRERVISVAWFALIPSERLRLRAASDADAVGWFAVHELPALAFDHAQILEKARQRLASKLAYSTIAFQFMPRQFTLSELQSVYEVILDEPLDKRNFRKSILATGELVDTGKQRRDGPHRPARLYRRKHPEKVAFTK